MQAAAAASPGGAPGYKILQYQYIPEILERRGPHREGHLSAAKQLVEQGKCVLGGAAGDPVSLGVFVLKGMSDEVRHRMEGLLIGFNMTVRNAMNDAMCGVPKQFLKAADQGNLSSQTRHRVTQTITSGSAEQCQRLQDIKQFVETDPYFVNGLVTDWCAAA